MSPEPVSPIKEEPKKEISCASPIQANPAEIRERLDNLFLTIAAQRILEGNKRPDSDFAVKDDESHGPSLKPYIDETVLQLWGV